MNESPARFGHRRLCRARREWGGSVVVEQPGDVVAGGYFIVPSTEVVSASSCVTELFPRSELVETDSASRESARESAKQLGVADDRLPDLEVWLNEALRSGTLRWPSILRSPNDARSLARTFELPTDQLVLVGIALPERDIADFLDDEPFYEPQWVQAIKERRRLADGGEPLGFEVLGLDGEDFHSWRCNLLEKVAAEKFGVLPNEHGFIRTLEGAECVAEFANVESNAEPCLWLPWLVVRYGWE